jgi:membrane protease subunit (stomatin/prohibitin family)
MADILDAEWRANRGFEVQSVGISSISYDEESTKLIHMRNQGAMLSDSGIREGYVQGAIARGLESAGSNPSGSMAGFMGINMGNQTAGGFVATASQANQQKQEAPKQTTSAPEWSCSCGNHNTGKFCSECGKAKPEIALCPHCGSPLLKSTAKFCPECGKSLI